MEKNTLLEVCVDSVESAVAAWRGGADRLELCANLVIGGTTPGLSLFRQVQKHCGLPIYVLIRPRYGDFLYTEEETQMMEEDIQSLTALGADGIVVGGLCADGTLDREKMKRFRQAAGDVPITLHRAFDMCREPERVMEEAIALGISTILTSGQAKNCREGAERIKQMIGQAGDRISVLVGGGVNGENIPQLMQETKATWFHMSGKVSLKSGMLYRKAEVHMGIPGMDEYQILRTSEELVRQAKVALGRRSGLGN